MRTEIHIFSLAASMIALLLIVTADNAVNKEQNVSILFVSLFCVCIDVKASGFLVNGELVNGELASSLNGRFC